jgi:hypothetical protein
MIQREQPAEQGSSPSSSGTTAKCRISGQGQSGKLGRPGIGDTQSIARFGLAKESKEFDQTSAVSSVNVPGS